jgi:hypothetical protein
VELREIGDYHSLLAAASLDRLLDPSLYVAGGQIYTALCHEARSTGRPAEPPLF